MEQTQLQAVWEQILTKMKETLAESAFKWFNSVKPISLTEAGLVLSVQNDLVKDWITSHYLTIVEDAVSAVLGSKHKVSFQIMPEAQPEPEPAPPEKAAASTGDAKDTSSSSHSSRKKEDPNQGTLFQEQPPAPVDNGDMHIVAPGDRSSLNPKYTFETFVTGSSNRFAHAAAMAVAESPGKVYNPFFMYGGVGLGKTHLMHAIGHKILQNHPEMRVLYISSEKFTNELINSIRDGNPEAFRQKYRNIDVLLVDDIQFLSKKEHTQEEFFHTFNTLHDANKHIILSSDRHPREIQTLEDRLRSRFEWGLITDIQAPDLETRIAILKKKALLENLNVPNDVMVYIASRIDNNIRELEGALTRVVAYASLTKQTISTDLVAEALKNVFPSTKTKEITLELIQEIVASYFKIKIDDLHAKKRTRNLAFPRQIAMYLCRELTDTSLPQIGTCFGGRDHTTVIHAYDKISKERNEDIKLDNTIKELIGRIERM